MPEAMRPVASDGKDESEIRPQEISEERLRGMEENAKARHAKQELKLIAEVRRLRLLIRNEQIVPPFDITDDMTTEFAVELAFVRHENETLKDQLAGLKGGGGPAQT